MINRLGLSGILLISLLLSACSQGPEKFIENEVKQFFSAISRGDFEAARQALTTPMQQRTTADALQNFITATGLQNPKGIHWQTPAVNDNLATIDGEVEAGEIATALPVRLHMVLENSNKWRISGVSRGVWQGTGHQKSAVFAPDDSESAALARETMHQFALGVQKNDLSDFWNAMAPAFRERFNLARFSDAFKGFMDNRTNLMPAAKRAPRFSFPPRLEPNGELVLKGDFPTQPSRVKFEYRYLNDKGNWQLSGITINLVPSS
jgi:hypothetical protein